MKISQDLTPAAFEFAGCTSAACAPPNKKGSGGTGGSIKGHTAKGGGPTFHPDSAVSAALAKAMKSPLPSGKQEVYRGTGGTSGTGGAGGGRSSMRSSVDNDKSRAIAAARGDAPSGRDQRANTRNRPIRNATDEEYKAYAKMAKEKAEKLGDRETINDTYERTGGVAKKKAEPYYANRDEKTGFPPGYVTEDKPLRDKEHDDHDNQVGVTNTRKAPAAPRESSALRDRTNDKDFIREKAKFDATIKTPAQKSAARKKRENSRALAEYKTWIRDRNRIL